MNFRAAKLRSVHAIAVNSGAMSESRHLLKDAHRIVVKLGTHVVTDDGLELARERLTDIVEGVAQLRRAGIHPRPPRLRGRRSA